MVKRQAVEDITRQKHLMVAALYSNSNWDDGKDTRSRALKGIEESFNRAMEMVYDPPPEVEEIDWDNPFWAAAKRAYERKLALQDGQREGTVAELIPHEEMVARAKARQQRETDQS